MAICFIKEARAIMIKAEDIKGINLVEFLTCHYGMKFSFRGREYVGLSSFTSEKEPSFYVRLVDGKWLFKDFASGHGGSLIDFVLIKEGFSEVAEALEHIQKVLGSDKVIQTIRMEDVRKEKSYNLKQIYQRIKVEDLSPCKDYLLGRGIAGEVIEDLSREGLVLHNRYQGHSWCCFAVFDQGGDLCCLDNHKIDGGGKFVLGKKSIFTCDWKILPQAKAVFICEGIIDYLSMKTLLKGPMAGIALLGNSVGFDPGLLKNTKEIISALDSDEGGFAGLLEVRDKFSDKQISVFNLGDCKDPNEYLMAAKEGKEETSLNPEDKLRLYKEFMSAENKTEVAQKWGINRSYMYEIIKECEENIISGFSYRRLGRKPQHAPATLDEAIDKIKTLEDEKERAEVEKEKYYARSEFMKLRLKWAQIEADELRGKKKEQIGKNKQVKKKKKRRP
jgi:DNA primase